MFDYVRCRFSIRAKAKLGAIRIFVEVSSQVDHGIVIRDHFKILITENVAA